MGLTYNEALNSIIEHTEIGYTLRSQDRLWVVFAFDLESEDEFRYNRVYTRGIGKGWGYDLTIPGVLCWTSRWEAEAFARRLRNHLTTPDGTPKVYVMNLGDSARYEAQIIGHDNGREVRSTPKFKGSEQAWDACVEMSKRWRAQYR